MSNKFKKILPLYFALFIYLIINILFQFTKYQKLYVLYLNPIFLLLIFVLTYFITKDFRFHIRNKYAKRQNVIIIVFGYCIIYYLSGLVFGFLKNGYSLTINGIISNFLSLFIVVIFEEYIRYKIIITSSTKTNLFLITLIFILSNINFNYIASSQSINILKYSLEYILPIILLNVTLTYLAYRVDLISNMLYRVVITAITLFSPIIPNHEWIITDFIYILMLMLFIGSIDYLTMLDDRKNKKRDLKKEKSSWPLFIISFIFILFIMGVFKYQPIAIMSDSMYNCFSRGDVVIIEKIDKENIKELKEGDIIRYQHGNTYITHRIIRIESRNGTTIYHTKGDNNSVEDFFDVEESDINGIIKFRIKYLGWPSVWLYELLH